MFGHLLWHGARRGPCASSCCAVTRRELEGRATCPARSISLGCAGGGHREPSGRPLVLARQREPRDPRIKRADSHPPKYASVREADELNIGELFDDRPAQPASKIGAAGVLLVGCVVVAAARRLSFRVRSSADDEDDALCASCRGAACKRPELCDTWLSAAPRAGAAGAATTLARAGRRAPPPGGYRVPHSTSAAGRSAAHSFTSSSRASGVCRAGTMYFNLPPSVRRLAAARYLRRASTCPRCARAPGAAAPGGATAGALAARRRRERQLPAGRERDRARARSAAPWLRHVLVLREPVARAVSWLLHVASRRCPTACTAARSTCASSRWFVPPRLPRRLAVRAPCARGPRVPARRSTSCLRGPRRRAARGSTRSRASRPGSRRARSTRPACSPTPARAAGAAWLSLARTARRRRARGGTKGCARSRASLPSRSGSASSRAARGATARAPSAAARRRPQSGTARARGPRRRRPAATRPTA